MSRIRTLVLLATVAALAVAFAACGGGGGDSAAAKIPQKVIDSATLEGVESGNLDLSLSVKSTGNEARQHRPQRSPARSRPAPKTNCPKPT